MIWIGVFDLVSVADESIFVKFGAYKDIPIRWCRQNHTFRLGRFGQNLARRYCMKCRWRSESKYRNRK